MRRPQLRGREHGGSGAHRKAAAAAEVVVATEANVSGALNDTPPEAKVRPYESGYHLSW